MAVMVSGVTVEVREIMLRDKSPEMLAVSPKGTVPVLILPDGRVIEESLDVMQWALMQNDPEGWLGRFDDAMIAANDGPFKAALDRYKYPHRFGLSEGTSYRQEGLTFLLSLNSILKHRSFLAGTVCGMTDIAVLPFIRQFAATDIDWFATQPLDNLHLWLDGLLKTPLFLDVMQRYAPWKFGDVPTHFP
jgi:glutathione S-transferase